MSQPSRYVINKDLWRRTVQLPSELVKDLLSDIESYWGNVLEVMENYAKSSLHKAIA